MDVTEASINRYKNFGFFSIRQYLTRTVHRDFKSQIRLARSSAMNYVISIICTLIYLENQNAELNDGQR